ncbi:hypothetical protein EXS74_02285 [Candidatus Woesearchaeota archaeon]|nr:hypothetical protein [Candidatus Woesearchaeota archaeon]
MNTKTKVYSVIAIVICLALVYYIFTLAAQNSQNCATAPAAEIDVGGDQNVVYHIHPQLNININGEDVVIPTNIGLTSGIMRPLHTHDTTGEIHVESPCERDFVLGDFFDLWGKTFTSTCILDSCVDENHTLTMYVNGIESTEYRDLILKDKNEIEIIYEETV